jgi:hypothetical protein
MNDADKPASSISSALWTCSTRAENSRARLSRIGVAVTEDVDEKVVWPAATIDPGVRVCYSAELLQWKSTAWSGWAEIARC